jgi:S1-C subfamily serine protease
VAEPAPGPDANPRFTAPSMARPEWLDAERYAAIEAAVQGVDEAARQAVEATVTVRAVSAAALDRKQRRLENNALALSVVSSGVSLGDGLVVTIMAPFEDAVHRITRPGGEQVEARAAVIDEATRLCLLETPARGWPALAPTTEELRVGSAVLAASAAGVRSPAVSLGIIGRLDGELPGQELPPLIQCDVRTTVASAGGPLVDRNGRLLGVILSAGDASDPAGWSFAVPVSALRRVIAARRPGQTVRLPRVRVEVGLRLGPAPEQNDRVQVVQVRPGGPADRAGVQVGDVVEQIDQTLIRNPYQAAGAAALKQPGETIDVWVNREGERRKLQVQLEAGEATPESLAAKGPETQAELAPPAEPFAGKLPGPSQVVTRAMSPRQALVSRPNEEGAGQAEPAAASGKADQDRRGELEARVMALEQSLARLEALLTKLVEARATATEVESTPVPTPTAPAGGRGAGVEVPAAKP